MINKRGNRQQPIICTILLENLNEFDFMDFFSYISQSRICHSAPRTKLSRQQLGKADMGYLHRHIQHAKISYSHVIHFIRFDIRIVDNITRKWLVFLSSPVCHIFAAMRRFAFRFGIY